MATSRRSQGSGESQPVYSADPQFLTHHALRIKGFAKAESLADIVALAVGRVEENLHRLADRGYAIFRDARSLWQLTPEGRQAHRTALDEDVRNLEIDALHSPYRDFLDINDRFKSLCGQWQLRDGQPNDHSDQKYDGRVISRLSDLNRDAKPIVASMAHVVPRLAPYAMRLDAACSSVENGSHQLFTGVMCGSYHDIWMELHEDLILTQGIDRSAEGSY